MSHHEEWAEQHYAVTCSVCGKQGPIAHENVASARASASGHGWWVRQTMVRTVTVESLANDALAMQAHLGSGWCEPKRTVTSGWRYPTICPECVRTIRQDTAPKSAAQPPDGAEQA